MRIESVTLSGFRCFGPEAITVPIAAEITAVVGPNAAGKTALLYALATLFGVTRAQRTVQRTDFHMGTDDDPDDREAKNLFIDVLIGLPELDDGTATPETIAPSFRHMQIEREGKTPVCRMRLEARWEDDGTIDGEVSQDLFWVDTLDDCQRHDAELRAAQRRLSGDWHAAGRSAAVVHRIPLLGWAPARPQLTREPRRSWRGFFRRRSRRRYT